MYSKMKNCPNCKSEMPNEHDVCWKCNYDILSKKVLPHSEIVKTNTEGKVLLNIDCLRCNVPLVHQGSRKFHEGSSWGAIGDLGHLFTNKESFDLYICPSCSKIEFFAV